MYTSIWNILNLYLVKPLRKQYIVFLAVRPLVHNWSHCDESEHNSHVFTCAPFLLCPHLNPVPFFSGTFYRTFLRPAQISYHLRDHNLITRFVSVLFHCNATKFLVILSTGRAHFQLAKLQTTAVCVRRDYVVLQCTRFLLSVQILQKEVPSCFVSETHHYLLLQTCRDISPHIQNLSLHCFCAWWPHLFLALSCPHGCRACITLSRDFFPTRRPALHPNYPLCNRCHPILPQTVSPSWRFFTVIFFAGALSEPSILPAGAEFISTCSR